MRGASFSSWMVVAAQEQIQAETRSISATLSIQEVLCGCSVRILRLPQPGRSPVTLGGNTGKQARVQEPQDLLSVVNIFPFTDLLFRHLQHFNGGYSPQPMIKAGNIRGGAVIWTFPCRVAIRSAAWSCFGLCLFSVVFQPLLTGLQLAFVPRGFQ